jgi:NAD(P)-dependent dehydrogenase (short-subunit alcohol dehydrogenase family)
VERLKGKAILVAGAGAIGDELARRYAREGASVVLGDFDGARAERVAGEIKASGGQAIGVQLDGTNEASIADAVAAAKKAFGGLDGMHVNFARFDGGDHGILDVPMEAFDAVINANLRGYALCTRAVLPELIARGGGSIVYTSSIAAYRSTGGWVAYSMAKAAILALMRHVASKHGPDGVRCNAIAPGTIRRPDQPELFGEEMVAWATGSQLIKSRIGEPADIAAVGALLLSDDGGFITGQTIAVDGGMTTRA